MTHQLRKDLPPLPDRIKRLPVDRRGYPVPWFVQWINGEPEFRLMDGEKWTRAVKEKLCWVCGQQLGRNMAFVIGPMCAVNRISSEPPSHLECAEFSAIACPFLTRPHMRRREAGLPDDHGTIGGTAILRNPGVAVVWVTRSYTPIKVHNGYLIEVGDPLSISCYTEGRRSSVDEIRASFESGLPALRQVAQSESPDAVAALEAQTAAARELLGIPA